MLAAGSQRTYNLVFSVCFKCSLFKSQVENLCVTKQFRTKKTQSQQVFEKKNIWRASFSLSHPKNVPQQIQFSVISFFFSFSSNSIVIE